MSRTLKVLLIEDNPAEADLVRMQLSYSDSPKFSVEHAPSIGNGETALKAVEFDVILLDYNLPDCEGLEGLSRIHGIAADIPIIMLTSFNDAATATQALRLGAQDYLPKRDADTEHLSRAIRYALERQESQRALRASEERYSLALAGANDGIWDWDIKADQVHYSDRWKQMLGLEVSTGLRTMKDWLLRVHDADRDSLELQLDAHLQGATPCFEHEHRIQQANGEYLWVLCRGLVIRDLTGKAIRMAGSMSNITRRKEAEAQLMHEALHDALTGLPNRTLFLDRVQQALSTAKRSRDYCFSVLFFDLNRFKDINDSLGHAIGDALLCAVGERLSAFIRPSDTLARLGGDEFAILLFDDPERESVTHVASRVHELLSEPFYIEANELFTTASIGIASASEKYVGPDELLRDADLAMYRAKNADNKPYEIFDINMHRNAMERLRLENDLRHALDNDEFVVHYQPIVSTETGQIDGFEALLRWNHPRLGFLYPDTFIQIAEDSGLVVPIGWWVLHEACRQIRDLQAEHQSKDQISVSVNISGKIFNGGEVATRLMDVLQGESFDPQALHLEITERSIMDHQHKAITELDKLREAGIGLHIDDFGTGYSSLSHLQKFSYDTLKIDKSFVNRMSSCSDSEAIVKSIVALGKMLNMNVVAEGVETEEQLSWLRKIGCPQVQGYLFSPAVDEESLRGLMQRPWEQKIA